MIFAPPWRPWSAGALLAVQGVATLAIAGWWARQDPRARRALYAAAIAGALLAVPAVLVWVVRPWPRALMTISHEGNADARLLHVYGLDDHAGPMLQAFREFLAGAGPTSLVAAIRGNAILAWWTAVWVAFLCARLAGVAVGIVGGLLSVALAPVWHALLSESPSVLVAAQVASGAVAASALVALPRRALRTRRASIGALAVCAVATVATRPEWVVVAVPTILLAAVVWRKGSAAPLQYAVDRLWLRVLDWPRWPLWGHLVVVLLLVAPWREWSSQLLVVRQHVGYALGAVINALSNTACSVFPLARLATPLLAILVALGVGRALMASGRTLAVAWSGLFLNAVYGVAGHGYRPELFRYAGSMAPFWPVFAAYGLPVAGRWARAWGLHRSRVALVTVAGLAAALTVLPVPRRVEMCPFDGQFPPPAPHVGDTVDRRLALWHGWLRDAFPECLFLERTADVAVIEAPDRVEVDYRWWVWGAGMTYPQEVFVEPRSAADGWDRLRAEADGAQQPCVLVVRNADCDLRETDRCAGIDRLGGPLGSWTADATVVWNHGHWGTWPWRVSVGLRELRSPWQAVLPGEVDTRTGSDYRGSGPGGATHESVEP